MMNKTLILLTAVLLFISCKDENTIPLDSKITGNIENSRFIKNVACETGESIIQLPKFQGTQDEKQRLHQKINELFELESNIEMTAGINSYVEEKKTEICNHDPEIISATNVEHITQNSKIISYELTYVKNSAHKRILATYLKEGLTPIKLGDLIKEGKDFDVARIFDINMQQSVADLLLEIPHEKSQGFRDYVRDHVFAFETEEVANLEVGIRQSVNGKTYLQVYKKIDLPQGYKYLNEDIKIEIECDQLGHYLNIAQVM